MPGPNVLAYRRREQLASELDEAVVVARQEVALLVEDAVVRQPALAVDAKHPAVTAQRRRIVEPALVAVDEAHERRMPARRGDALERVEIVVYEVALRARRSSGG